MKTINFAHKRPNRHRLSVDVPDIVFDKLVEVCEQKETTITKYVIGSIIARIAQEEKYNK